MENYFLFSVKKLYPRIGRDRYTVYGDKVDGR